ncbi:oxidoreductase [Bacillus sp. JCM 19047]|nr:oxidoreductase [Bacillus sp. JCM 19047]
MKTIWITGASSGLGEAVLNQLKGHHFQIVKLASRYQNLIETEPNVFECKLDLSDITSIHHVVGELKEANLIPDIVINNAGIGQFAESWEIADEDVERVFQVNIVGLIQFTNRVIPLMMANGHGHIVQIASQAGKVATAKASVYAATKHALIGYSNGLRLELKPYAIDVSVMNPGPIHTPFLKSADKSGTYGEKMGAHLLQPDEVAKRVVKTLSSKEREINLPNYMTVVAKMHQLAPGLVEKIGKRFFYKKE